MLRDPTNIDVTLLYARLSILEQDFEAAVSSLERLLNLDPALQDARLELALAYFALGANETARYHLEIYRDRGDLTPAELEQANAYIESANKRESRLRFSGIAELDTIHRTKTNDTGYEISVAAKLDYDLQRANLAVWETILRFRAYNFPQNNANNQHSWLIRTGPNVTVDGTTFGARVTPYLEFQIVEDANDNDAGRSVGVGSAFSNVFDNGVTVDADVQYGYIFREGLAFDSKYFSLRASTSLQPLPDLEIGFTARYFDENLETGGNDRTRVGGRVGASYTTGRDFLGMEKWTLGAFVRYDLESFSTGREDDLFSGGVSVRSYFRANSYVKASVRKFDRSSSDPRFDKQDTLFTLGAGMEF